MPDAFSRARLLFGADGMERLKRARVAVFGLGGVGGYVTEALARSGIGALDLIDDDRVCLTNMNRQILATTETIGRYKAEVARERIVTINPKAAVNIYKIFFGPDTAEEFDFARYDYIADAIDTVTGKLELVTRAQSAGTRIISCMGAGNKINATGWEVADIYQTSMCPLARVMRRELKKRGVKSLKVVYSKEPPMTPIDEEPENNCHSNCVCPPGAIRKCTQRRQIPGSNAFVPAVAGLIMAGEIIKDLIV